MENLNLLNKNFLPKPKKPPELYIVRQPGTPCITIKNGKIRRSLRQESWLSQKNCKKI